MQPRAETKTGEKSEDKEWVGDRLGAEVDGQEKNRQKGRVVEMRLKNRRR